MGRFGMIPADVLSSLHRHLIVMRCMSLLGVLQWPMRLLHSVILAHGFLFPVHLASILLAVSGLLKQSIGQTVPLTGTRRDWLLEDSLSSMALTTVIPSAQW